jgi:hypothetical protein
MFKKIKNWANERKFLVLAGLGVAGCIATAAVLAILLGDEDETKVEGMMVAAVKLPKLSEDLPTEGLKWVWDRWVEHRENGDAQIIITHYVPISEIDEFVETIKKCYKDEVCFVIDGR